MENKEKVSKKVKTKNNVLGLRISRLRIEKDISQNAFANSIDMDRKAYAKIEAGVSLPLIPTLYKIANAFDVSPLYLLEGIELEF